MIAIKFYVSILLIATAWLFLFPLSVLAAELRLVTDDLTVPLGSEVVVNLSLDTLGETVSAVSGRILVPENIFVVQDLRYGDSAVRLWVESPHEASGAVSFSGIFPGGLRESQAFILSLILRADKVGSGLIRFESGQAVKNDGQGTILPTVLPQLTVNVVSSGEPVSSAGDKDITPPQAFTPIIARNPDMFNNRFFLIFQTQDTGSGIAYYDIFESRKYYQITKLGSRTDIAWRRVNNPAVLGDQSLRSFIYVKAVDRAGNYWIAMTRPVNWYLNFQFLSIIIIVVAVLLTGVWLFLRLRFKR